jgi:hypothetical protein
MCHASAATIAHADKAVQSTPLFHCRRSVEFHHSGELLLTAGLDQRVHLFTVDGVK